MIFAKANPKHYPAIAIALDSIEQSVNLSRDDALKIEAKNFVKSAKTPQATALVGVFLNDQVVKKHAKKHAQNAREVNTSAVIGAGIMGGGIAYQSALKGVPIVMKDIGNAQLELGIAEATKLLTKQIDKGKATPQTMGETLARIRPTLSYDDFKEVDMVIEAVTENVAVKEKVLSQTEEKLGEKAILASNTSTISITQLAKSLKRPENFVGMHFFNPVPMMPLVEVIKGEQTSDEAVATAVAYAQKWANRPLWSMTVLDFWSIVFCFRILGHLIYC